MSALPLWSTFIGLVLVAGVRPPLGASQPAGTPTLPAVIERAQQATVGILDETIDQSPRQAQLSVRGTGVHLGDGFIVTARHVVERPERGAAEPTLPKEIRLLTARLQELTAHLSHGSSFLDLVVYRLVPEHRPSLPAQASFTEAEPQPGEEVFTVGYPLGWGPAMAFGRIGNPSTFLPSVDTRLLQADVSVCSGNSGGGLFSVTGELTGVMHAIIQTERGKEALGNERCSRFAFAVPSALAKRIVLAVRSGKAPSFSRLGVRMQTIKEGDGWRITAGEVSGPALTAGLKKGDALLAIDGIELRDPAHLKNYLMERTEPGQKVILKIRRGSDEYELPVTLGGA